MKKIILIAALMLGFAVAASAQQRALGLRGGYGVELSYQYTIGADFLEADLGLLGSDLNLSATYNYMIAKPDWTDRGEWGFYAGPGVAVGLGTELVVKVDEMARNISDDTSVFCNIAVAGQVGLEYTFWFPLQLSVDLRPQIGIHLASKSGFYFGGWWPAFSVRYKF